MFTDRSTAFGEIRRLVIGRRAPILPAQQNWWGWLRAALAFQPARPVPRGTPPDISGTARVRQTPAATGGGRSDAPRPLTDGSDLSSEELRLAISTLPPAERLTLRRHPAVTVGILSGSLVKHLEEQREITRRLVLTISRNGDFDREGDLDQPLSRALIRTQNIARSLARIRDRVQGIAGDIDLARADQIAGVLEGALALDLSLDVAIARARALDGSSVRMLDAFLSWTLRDARSLDRLLDRELGDLLGLPDVEGVGALLAEGLLDDFREADLSGVDLAGFDLEGVRWSERGTRWPPGEEDRMRRASRETEPGSGVWVVEPGTPAADMALV